MRSFVRWIEWLGDLLGVRYAEWARTHEPWSFAIEVAAVAAGGAIIVSVGWRLNGEGTAVIFGAIYFVSFLVVMAWVGLKVRKIRRQRVPIQPD
jgi:hypothetical protein